jgi:hypothetical protein
MKALTLTLSAAALVAFAASPASAAARKHVRHHHVHYVHDVHRYQPLNTGPVSSGGPIYQQGFYLGTDPDPNVRFEINRDPYFGRK